MNSNTVTVIIATLLLAAGAYWYFFTGTGNQQPLTATTAATNPEQTKFQELVNELQPISFDTSIFTDPSFTSLIDITTPVTPEPSGRADPFALIPGAGGK